MKFSAILLAGIFLLSLKSPGQESGASPAPPPTPSEATNLQITAEARVPFLGGLAGRARCDADGNVYLRPANGETFERYHPISALPITKIKPGGSFAGSFSVADAWPRLRATDFSVVADGKVYQAARSETDRSVYLVSYLPNGSPRSKIRLDADFLCRTNSASSHRGDSW